LFQGTDQAIPKLSTASVSEINTNLAIVRLNNDHGVSLYG
jgi:hypothetical protein